MRQGPTTIVPLTQIEQNDIVNDHFGEPSSEMFVAFTCLYVLLGPTGLFFSADAVLAVHFNPCLVSPKKLRKVKRQIVLCNIQDSDRPYQFAACVFPSPRLVQNKIQNHC
jgi:hypothetical protein